MATKHSLSNFGLLVLLQLPRSTSFYGTEYPSLPSWAISCVIDDDGDDNYGNNDDAGVHSNQNVNGHWVLW